MMRIAVAVLLVVSACRGSSATAESASPEVDPKCPACPDDECPPTPTPIVLDCEADEQADGESSKSGEKLSLVKAAFADLPGWEDDELSEAVPAFLRSCEKLADLKNGDKIGVSPYGGKAKDWRKACKAASGVPAGDDAAARAFFEAQFKVYAAHGTKGDEAKLSGYYVQSLHGSMTRHDAYQTPIMARPPDLVETQLSDFIGDGRGRRTWGKVDPATGKLGRYPTRKQIRAAGLEEKHALLWVNHPADAVLVGIEGSGKVFLDDGSTVWIGFDGKNGRKFRGIGGILKRMGELDGGLSIHEWFEANPDRHAEITDLNESKVFFEIESREGAIGTQDAILTPRRSIAIDRAVIAFSTPVFVSGTAPKSARGGYGKWHQLLIAQDTGGAILGPIRGDIYWGDDDEAVAIGKRMGGKGKMWLLLPRGLKVRTK
jgi:membrane-bound lytic murein transglycosylase A